MAGYRGNITPNRHVVRLESYHACRVYHAEIFRALRSRQTKRINWLSNSYFWNSDNSAWVWFWSSAWDKNPYSLDQTEDVVRKGFQGYG